MVRHVSACARHLSACARHVSACAGLEEDEDLSKAVCTSFAPKKAAGIMAVLSSVPDTLPVFSSSAKAPQSARGLNLSSSSKAAVGDEEEHATGYVLSEDDALQARPSLPSLPLWQSGFPQNLA